MSKLAVIDIGTNSIHMVLAEILPDAGFKILDRFKDMTRLGNGVFATRRLSEESMTRALEVLKTLVTLARNKGFERIVAVATSAVREAQNGGDFVALILEHIGLRVRVISGIEEARLIFLGVKHSIALPDGPTLVVDIGGGSVELIVGNREGLIHGKSLKLGAIRLAEQFLPKTPPSELMMHALDDAVLTHLRDALGSFKMKRFQSLVATSGMAGNVGEVIHLRQTGRPLPQHNLATILLKDIRSLEAELAKSSVKARLAIPGLDPKRVDTLLPTAVVLRCLLELSGLNEITLCDKAIREGVIYDFIVRHREGLKAERDIPDVRRRNVVGLARRCQAPEAHSLHVADLALSLFDQTKREHRLEQQERTWLEYAAILHDVGYLINPRQHHKHAYYLIKHSDLGGLAAEEIDVVANIARYHRRALPSLKHEAFACLTPRLQRVVKILASLLRIADGLDRTHFSLIRSLSVKFGKQITIEVHLTADAEMELWAAKSRADLFEQAFRRRVQFSGLTKNRSLMTEPHLLKTACHPYPGKLIIVEGIDGSGKSTQLQLLHKWLESKGHRVFFTEWNSSALVKETTKRGKKSKSLTPTTFSLLHATDFASRLYHQILPPLKAGMLVLADRYMYTAFARDVVRGVANEWVRKIYAFAIKPDMAFYFKVPIAVAISRLSRGTRGHFKYYEAGMDMDLSPDITESFRLFQSRILAEYDKIVDEYGLLTMDATQDIETQQEHMRALVEEALRGYKPRRGTYGRRTLFWRRFEVPRSE